VSTKSFVHSRGNRFNVWKSRQATDANVWSDSSSFYLRDIVNTISAYQADAHRFRQELSKRPVLFPCLLSSALSVCAMYGTYLWCCRIMCSVPLWTRPLQASAWALLRLNTCQTVSVLFKQGVPQYLVLVSICDCGKAAIHPERFGSYVAWLNKTCDECIPWRERYFKVMVGDRLML